MKKVIVAGHICLDITPVFQGDVVARPEDILQPGKLIQMGSANIHTGGAVANTGLAMAALGLDVRLVAKTGADEFGANIEKILNRYGAEYTLLAAEGESTSYSVILAIPGVDRMVLHHPGANDTFSADDLSDEELKDCTLFHFGYPNMMRRMYQKDGAELVSILQKAKKAGAATSLDFTMLDADTEAGRADWRAILAKALPYVDFFVPSVEELCFMLDRERYASWQERAAGRDVTEILDVQQDVKPLADRCMALGVKVLLLKCGAPGIYYRTADKETLRTIEPGIGWDAAHWAEKEGFEVSYVPERVLSGIGAGDISIAAFLTAVLKGYSPEWCLHLAVAAGASCVASYDALSGLPSFEKLETKIRNGWKKYGEEP